MILHSHDRLDIKRQEAVFALARAATQSDGFNPLSEHVALHLRAGGDEADSHFTLADEAGVLIGYAHLDQTDLVAGPSAELVVDPSARQRGGGRMLTNELVRVAGPRLRLWSHGDLAESEALASALGFVRIREVIQLRRSLELPLPKFQIPESIKINQFDAGTLLDASIKVRHSICASTDSGATEVHIVGGLHPWLKFDYYLDMLRGIRSECQRFTLC